MLSRGCTCILGRPPSNARTPSTSAPIPARSAPETKPLVSWSVVGPIAFKKNAQCTSRTFSRGCTCILGRPPSNARTPPTSVPAPTRSAPDTKLLQYQSVIHQIPWKRILSVSPGCSREGVRAFWAVRRQTRTRRPRRRRLPPDPYPTQNHCDISQLSPKSIEKKYSVVLQDILSGGV
jgi:hypothetical protein